MKFELEEYHRNTPLEDLIADIKNVAKKLSKKSVTKAEYQKYGKYSDGTIERRFGSWNKALKTANLQINIKRDISDQELFENLEDVWTKLGRQPKYVEIKKPLSRFSTGPYDKRFGSFRKALEKFISYINSDSISEDKVSNNSSENNIKTENTETIFRHKTKRNISDRLRFRILMRDGFTCKKCGRSPIKERDVELHVDHVTPWSKDGETIPENLETKCSRCNLGKGNAFNE